jgi:hypothetical protein
MADRTPDRLEARSYDGHPCPLPFPWHQIQRADIRFQGKTGTVLLRPRGTLKGEISLCFHLKCSKSVPLLPRRARAKESTCPIPALPVLRVPPGGGRNAPDDGVKSRWRIEAPTGWKRGRTTGIPARYRFLGTRFNGRISVFRARPGRSCYAPEGHSQAKSPWVSI